MALGAERKRGKEVRISNEGYHALVTAESCYYPPPSLPVLIVLLSQHGYFQSDVLFDLYFNYFRASKRKNGSSLLSMPQRSEALQILQLWSTCTDWDRIQKASTTNTAFSSLQWAAHTVVLSSILLFLLLLTTMALLCFILRCTTKVFWMGIQFLHTGCSHQAAVLTNARLCSTTLKWVKHEETCASFHLTQVHASVCAATRQRHSSSLKLAWIPNSIRKQEGHNPIGILSGQSYSFGAFKQIGTGIDCSPWLRYFWSSTKLSQTQIHHLINPHFTINLPCTHNTKLDTKNTKWKWKFV